MTTPTTGCGVLLNPNSSSDRCGQHYGFFGGEQHFALCERCQEKSRAARLEEAPASRDAETTAVVKSVEALDIQPGNVVLLRVAENPNLAELDSLAKQVRSIVPATSTIAILQGDTDMQALTDESMLKNGWIRKSSHDATFDALARLLTWHDAIHGDQCDYTGDHPLAVAKAVVHGHMNALIAAYTGTSLHIVLDDGNYLAEDVSWAMNEARKNGDGEGVKLAEHLLLLSDEQRRVLLGQEKMDGAS